MAEVNSIPVPATPEKNPKEWVENLSKGPLKKVAYLVLEWIYKQTGAEDAVPGAKKQETSPKEFMGALKDGTLLCKLANKVQPDAVDTVHEGPETTKEQQVENVQKFVDFAKEKTDVKEEVKAEEVNEGKGFQQILAMLVSLGTQGVQKLGQEGLDAEALLKMVSQGAGKNFLQNLLDKIFKRQPSGEKKAGEKSNGDAPAEAQNDAANEAPKEAPKEAQNEAPADTKPMEEEAKKPDTPKEEKEAEKIDTPEQNGQPEQNDVEAS